MCIRDSSYSLTTANPYSGKPTHRVVVTLVFLQALFKRHREAYKQYNYMVGDKKKMEMISSDGNERLITYALTANIIR